jgi:outer membrane protein OmpA-like peptidoglycan-associated protein
MTQDDVRVARTATTTSTSRAVRWEPDHKRGPAALLGALGLAGLLASSAVWARNSIEDDLTKKAEQLSLPAGASISFDGDGQDGTLTVPFAVDSAEAKALKAQIEDIKGVRKVTLVGGAAAPAVEPTPTAAPTPAPTAAPTSAAAPSTTAAPAPTAAPAAAASIDKVKAVINGDLSVVLTGVAASAAHKTLLGDAAIAAYGEANVTNNMTVASEGEPDADSDAAVEATAKLYAVVSGSKLLPGSVEINDTTITVAGTPATADDKSAIEGEVETLNSNPLTALAELNAPADEQAVEAIEAIDLQGIEFDVNEATIRPESIAILDNAADVLTKFPSVNFEIGGHTDTTGNADSNQRLSEARARAVLDYLVGKGIAADRLTAVGFGETKPLASPENTDADKQRNRRIEFTQVEG